MTTTRKAIIAFWILVVILLLWNFYEYNRGLTQAAVDHPAQEHFYFFHTNAPTYVAPVHHDGPDVQQVAFIVHPDTPASGSFTCQVTVKNLGNVKASGIQVCVRPYRGVSTIDIDVGGNRGGTLSDDDPISQISDWLIFPDLGPGESSTENDVFLNRSDISPGSNPKPQIIFKAVKPDSTAPATPTGMPPPRQPGA